ncbi:MAG: Peptidase [Planctomycetota bacterium]|nr:Peptidase [Planctomycetota bacterium]
MSTPDRNEPASSVQPDLSLPMTAQSRVTGARRSPITWVLIAAGLVLAVVIARPILRSLTPAPRLEPAVRLLAEGKYAEAEAKLSEILAYEPSNPRARLAMADVLVSREEPDPKEALKLLARVRPAMPSQAAYALVLRGKAEKQLHHPGKAEADWAEALRLDPLVGEAGWLLLELYYTENRVGEARQLALRLSRNEPNARDRVRLLLEPIRFDAQPLAAAGIIPLFKEAVANDPDDRPAALAYYRAKARDGTGIEEAVTALRALVQRHPDDLACWAGLLDALDRTGDLDGMEKVLTSMPTALASGSQIARFRGRLALARKDYAGAIAEFEAALSQNDSDRELFHRLSEAYKLAGKAAEAEATKAREADIEAARVELRGIKGREEEEGRPGLFEDASQRPDLGVRFDPVLYKKLASLRERMRHPDEARAWHKLVLRDLPDDEESLAAVARLGETSSP